MKKICNVNTAYVQLFAKPFHVFTKIMLIEIFKNMQEIIKGALVLNIIQEI